MIFDDRAHAVDDSTFLDGGVFFIGDWDRTGQPHARLVFCREIEIDRGLADRVGRALARLQGVVVEDRLELDEGTLVRIR